jgi:glycosyltransferase involved in cell wall biosynthesis
MKNLLVVAYYFPPSGGPGVQRVLKHIKYLPALGWNPYVLTVENGTFPARDESLLKEIPEGMVVRRTHIFEPYEIYKYFTGKQGKATDVNNIKKEGQKTSAKDKIAEFLRATFFIPDARCYWRNNAVKAGLEMIDEFHIDAIYSSSPPYTTSLIARDLKRKSGLPWIAGFRDPWTKFLTTPKRWFIPAMIDRAFEKSVFKEANEVECAWQGIIDDARNKYPFLKAEKFHHVPNGFDSDDYPKMETKRNEKFTITYTGSLYGRRNPASLFQALEKLVERNVIDTAKLCLRFVGRFGDEINEIFETSNLKNCIETLDYVPHKKSIEYLLQSDALLLIVDDSKDSKDIVPGKVYEYIGTLKPVIAIAPENSAIADLIKEVDGGFVAEETDIDGIAAGVEKLYTRWLKGEDLLNTNTSAVNKYERKEATKELALLLNNFEL